MTARPPLRADDYPLRPRLTLRVAALARGRDAEGAEPIDCAPTLVLLARELTALQNANNALRAAAPYDVWSTADLRLLTPLAGPGTLSAAEAAREAGLAVEAVLPSQRDKHAGWLAAGDADRLEALWEGLAARLELNPPDEVGPREARAIAERAMIGHADAILLLENSGPDAGREATGSRLDEARRAGVIVLSAGSQTGLSLWRADQNAIDPAVDGEWLALDTDRGAEALRSALSRLVAFPADEPVHADSHHGPTRSARDCMEQFYGERARTGSLFFGFNLLRWLFAGRPHKPGHIPARYRLAENLDHAWAKSTAHVAARDDPAFAEGFETVLRRRWIFADNVAVHYSQAYRTAFVFNFYLSGLAVLVGLAAVLSWDDKGLKTWLVAGELALISAILTMTWAEKRGEWHQRWLHYRSIAEALRPSRLPALIGKVSGRLADAQGPDPRESWVGWYVRATFREVPLPSGRLGPDELRAVTALAISEEIDSQIAYHRANARRIGRLDHNLHRWATYLLYGTILSGLAYLAAYGLYKAGEVKWLLAEVKPVATFLGGVLPTFGAVMFGIRAIGDFRASAHQSERMVADLGELKKQLERESRAPRLGRVQQLLSRLTHVLADDQRIWSMIYAEREVTPGF